MQRHLFLLRHGQAGWDADDFHRQLTDVGRAQTKAVLSDHRAALERVTRIVASPYLRAQQTAQIAVSLLPLDSIETSPLLQPEADPAALIDWVQAQSGCLLLVGHNPLLTRALNLWIGAEPGREQMDTSTLVQLGFEVSAAGCAHLLCKN